MDRIRVWYLIKLSLLMWITLCLWVCVFFTLLKVVPIFGDFYREFGGRLPWPTRCVLFLHEFMKSWRFMVGLFAATAFVGFQFLMLHNFAQGVRAPMRWERLAEVLLIALGILVLVFIGIALYMPVWHLHHYTQW